MKARWTAFPPDSVKCRVELTNSREQLRLRTDSLKGALYSHLSGSQSPTKTVGQVNNFHVNSRSRASTIPFNTLRDCSIRAAIALVYSMLNRDQFDICSRYDPKVVDLRTVVPPFDLYHLGPFLVTWTIDFLR